MLEEKGGWIACEAPRQDEDMVEVVIKVMAKASQGTSKDCLNPF